MVSCLKTRYVITSKNFLTKHKDPRIKRIEFTAKKFLIIFKYEIELKMRATSCISFKTFEQPISKTKIEKQDSFIKIIYEKGKNQLVMPIIDLDKDELNLEIRSF